MSLVKYRLKEVAADFGVAPKEIAEIVAKVSEKPKSNTQVLTDEELNFVFDCKRLEIENIPDSADILQADAEHADQRQQTCAQCNVMFFDFLRNDQNEHCHKNNDGSNLCNHCRLLSS